MTEFQWPILLLVCKATLILGIVAALAAVAGRRWPRNCRTWQRSGVVALLALPLAIWALPTLGIPVLPTPSRIAEVDDVEIANELATAVSLAAVDRGGVVSQASASLPAAVSTERSTRGFTITGIRILGLILAAYGVVAMVLVIRFVRAWLGLARLRRESALVVDPAWQDTLAHWTSVLQVGRRVELRMSDTVSVPMTFGWRAPVILIPDDCLAERDLPLRDAIVVHELTHIAHGDFFWQLVGRVAAAMYWAHPLAWLICRQDRKLCERICDALCSQHLSRESYARSLVQIAGRKIFRPAAAPGIAMAQGSSIGRRLTDLQSSRASGFAAPNRTQRMILGGIAGVVLGLIVVSTLTARAVAEPPNDETPHVTSPQKPNAERDPPKAPIAPVRLPEALAGRVLDQQGKPLAGADVFLGVEGENPQPDGATPQNWTAKTDEQGRYRIETGAAGVYPTSWLRLRISAPGFAVLSQDFELNELQGELPGQRLYAGRTVRGRIVDAHGKPIAKGAVRFQAASSDYKMTWDSGPQAFDEQGAFAVAIPIDGLAAGVIYPRDLAPQFVDVPAGETKLGTIHVDRGTSLAGRVLDKEGRGVAGTVVALQSNEHRMLHLFGVLIGVAVKTDENGGFRLPPVRGGYRVLVGSGMPDYSRQCYLRGVSPPPILPRQFEFSGEEETHKVILREAGSVTVRGKVRWADGSAVPDVDVNASTLPRNWRSGAALDAARTDSEGNYVLRLPAPAERVIVSVHHLIRAADGTDQRARPVGLNVVDDDHVYDLLTADVKDADWVVGPKN